MSKATTKWLEWPQTRQMFWRTCYKLVAQNFFVNVDPEKHYRPDENGWVQLDIEQRADLFQVGRVCGDCAQKH